MKALISPIEPVQTGFRVAEVHETGFEVALPLFWVDCTDSIVANEFWFDPDALAFKPVPAPAPVNHDVQGVETL